MRPSRCLWAVLSVVGALAGMGLGPAAPAGVADDGMGMAMGMSSPSARVSTVSLFSTSYNPSDITILAGDTVNWMDVSTTHTVTADDGSFDSGRIYSGDMYTRQFEMPGVVTYYCQVHPFMHGSITIRDLLLSPAPTPITSHVAYPLRGRSSLPAGTTISIQADGGAGFQPLDDTTVAADGTFTAAVNPKVTTTYRAVAGSDVSPAVKVTVVDRTVLVSRSRRGGRDTVSVRVTPADPGATVVLQLNLKARFGWWPERVLRLGKSSGASFTFANDRRVWARVALTLRDGATQLAASRRVRVGPR